MVFSVNVATFLVPLLMNELTTIVMDIETWMKSMPIIELGLIHL